MDLFLSDFIGSLHALVALTFKNSGHPVHSVQRTVHWIHVSHSILRVLETWLLSGRWQAKDVTGRVLEPRCIRDPWRFSPMLSPASFATFSTRDSVTRPTPGRPSALALPPSAHARLSSRSRSQIFRRTLRDRWKYARDQIAAELLGLTAGAAAIYR